MRRLTIIPEPPSLSEQLRRKLEGGPDAPDVNASLREPLLAFLCGEFLPEDICDASLAHQTLGRDFELLSKRIDALRSDLTLRQTFDARLFCAELFGLFHSIAIGWEAKATACDELGTQALNRHDALKEAESEARHCAMHPDEVRALREVEVAANTVRGLRRHQQRRRQSWWGSYALAQEACARATEGRPLINAVGSGMNGFLLYVSFLQELPHATTALSAALTDYDVVDARLRQIENDEMEREWSRRHEKSVVASDNHWDAPEEQTSAAGRGSRPDELAAGTGADSMDFGNDAGLQFNPVTGLPMMDDIVDVHGNMFGTNNVGPAYEAINHTPHFDTGFGGPNGSGDDW